MKKVLIINGHPNPNSYNYGLQAAYAKGANLAGHQLEALELASLNFDPNLSKGYQSEQKLEPDLVEAQAKILWADHIVWIYPLWWGSMPGLLKAFLDRVLLPGFAFKYRQNSNLWDKLLAGKTTEIICTLDYPVWYFKWFLGEAGVKVMRKMVLSFCGLKTTRTTYIGPIRPSSAEQRSAWLHKIEQIASK